MFGYGTGGHDKGDFPPVFLKRKTPSSKNYTTPEGGDYIKALIFKKDFFFSLHKDPEGKGGYYSPQCPHFSRTFNFIFFGAKEDTLPTPLLTKNELMT